MNTRFSIVLSAAALLAACGGGGGGGGTGGGGLPPGPTPCPSGFTGTPPNCVQSTTTTQGTVVDDPSGTALSGVKVQLDPWTSYATPGPTPTPISTTTTDASGHFTLSNVPNGTYLLVIGDDDPTFPSGRATIHDRIVLKGGGSSSAPLTLSAPNMPAFTGYTPPAVETSGNYRLATIDTTTATSEAACANGFNGVRVSLSLPKAVVDEWLTENVRAFSAHAQSTGVTGGGLFLTSGSDVQSSTVMNPNCTAIMMEDTDAYGVFFPSGTPGDTSPYARNTQTFWVAGLTRANTGSGEIGSLSLSEFVPDPRVFTDPAQATIGLWP